MSIVSRITAAFAAFYKTLRDNGDAVVANENTTEKKMKSPLMHSLFIFVIECAVAAIVYYVLIEFLPLPELSELWLGVSSAYIVLTLRWWDVIPADKLAVRTRLGKPIDVLSSGLPIVPPGIYATIPFSTRTEQREFPAEPDKIFRPREDGDQTPPADMKPPIRVTFRSAISAVQAKSIFCKDKPNDEFQVTRADGKQISFNYKAEEDGLNEMRLTTEITPVVRWRIKDGIKYVRNIGSDDEVAKQIEDEAVSVLARICPQISASQAKANMEWLNELLLRAIKRRVGDDGNGGGETAWGIVIEGAYLKPISFSHGLNTEIADVVEAQFRKITTETDAAAERTRLTEEGMGRAAAEQALQKAIREGKAEGYAAIARATGLDGPTVVQLETAEAVGSSPSNTIFAGDTGVGSIAALAGAGFNASRDKKPSDSVEPDSSEPKSAESS